MALSEQMERQGAWLFKYRGILPLVIFVIAIVLFYKNETDPENRILKSESEQSIYELVCLLVSFLGFFIRIYTVGYSRPNTSGRNTEEQVADELNTTGIYSIMRNPLYVGNFFMWLGIAMLTSNFWFIISFILFYFLYYERIIFTEEQFLKNKFGDTFINWARKTPIIVPNYSSFKKTGYNFNWKKVLRQEKNGFAALLIIFCLFDLGAELLKVERHYNIPLYIAGVASIIIYFILKFIKYNTKLLQDPQ
ncbi:isoprenylcysteine carboxylmethyltransferase family protein [Daejeonella sp.]|uniref:methyltransferase family protein n=1 Tax=Daejeonella sp. TaxID=2805397 RepID=UPI0025B7ED33|nr:isoprenylcysteine carboxylmethyltransferase family protein [Daejeonella sp.]